MYYNLVNIEPGIKDYAKNNFDGLQVTIIWKCEKKPTVQVRSSALLIALVVGFLNYRDEKWLFVLKI